MNPRDSAKEDGAVKVYGVDFTSSPSGRKPIVRVKCELVGRGLKVVDVCEWSEFAQFEAMLASDGPWVAGIDFPFGLAREFLTGNDWPLYWKEYVDKAASEFGSSGEFAKFLNCYAKKREKGDKEHKRATDRKHGAMSPQNRRVRGMFFEGARRLRKANVWIPGLQEGGCRRRAAVEAYPAAIAAALIGNAKYKDDGKSDREPKLARRALLRKLADADEMRRYDGIAVSDAPDCIADDPKGDKLDALMCAVQAAWDYGNGYKRPNPEDDSEGWIANPELF